eukprot:c5311_g1_i1 orf=344-535(+)
METNGQPMVLQEMGAEHSRTRFLWMTIYDQCQMHDRNTKVQRTGPDKILTVLFQLTFYVIVEP